MLSFKTKTRQEPRHKTRDVFAIAPEGQPVLYILSPRGEPTPVLEHKHWQDWINTHDRVLARTDISDTLYVQTWFPGVNLRPARQPGPPLLFETEVYQDGKRIESYHIRAPIARAGRAHSNVVARLVAAQSQEVT